MRLKPAKPPVSYIIQIVQTNKEQTIPDAAAIPLPEPGFILEELDSDLLLFNPYDSSLLELNATAALVWQLCDGVRRVSEICDLLSTAFPEAGQTINEDVPRILVELRALDALTWQQKTAR